MLEICLSTFWLTLKIFLGLIVAYGLVLLAAHIRALYRIRFYEKQGGVLFPGCKRFFFGNNMDFLEYAKARAGAEPICGAI